MTKRLHSEIDIDEPTELAYKQLCDSFYPRPARFVHSARTDGPTIAAAGLQDTSKLQSILQQSLPLNQRDRSIHVLNQVVAGYTAGERMATPLLRAIERERPANIVLLL